MDKLQNLIERCKCGVYVSVNTHRNCHQTASEWLLGQEDRVCDIVIRREVKSEIIKRNSIIEIQFYPDTPISSFTVYHYDLEGAIDTALACFDR